MDSPVYSGRALRALWEYVLKYGEDIERFFDGVDVPRDRLLSEDDWFKLDTAGRIWKNYQNCLPGFLMEDSFHIGFSAMRGEVLGALKTVIRLLPVSATMTKLPEIQNAYSKIDRLRCLELGKGYALVEYQIHEAFRERHLDSAILPMVRGYLSAIPTLHGIPAARVQELCSCIDVSKRFTDDYAAFGHRVSEAEENIFLDGRVAGKWIRIGEHPGVPMEVERHLNGERAIIWERDVRDVAADGRIAKIASAGELYNLPVALLRVEWEDPAPKGRLQRFVAEIPGYLKALFRSKHELLKRMHGMQHRAADLERHISERTQKIKAANRKLAREVEERKLLEDRLWESIREKDLLLREIHHRVKNNLQVISSLMDMSANRTRDREAVDILTNARTKVQTMAMIHSRLFNGHDFESIEMEAQTNELFLSLAALYGKTDTVHFETVSTATELSVSQAMPCALVLNELISNSLKHAFGDRNQGRIEVTFSFLPNHNLEIHYRDNGIGLPETFDIHEADSLGLKLIRIIATVQLKGVFERLPGPGCGFRIIFPMEAIDDSSGRHPSG